MKIEPHVMQGPEYCAKEECRDEYCEHERTLGTSAIYWQTDDGEEYGQSCIHSIPMSDAYKRDIDRLLWYQYEQWAASEGQD